MSQFTLCLVKLGGLARMQYNPSLLISMLRLEGFRAMEFEYLYLSPTAIEKFYEEHQVRPYFDDLYNSVSGKIGAMVLYHPEEAIQRFRKLLGPTDARKAFREQPTSLRAVWGNQAISAPMADNGLHGSDSPESFAREMRIIFPEIDPITRPGQ